jgi:hypothetical protein
LAKRSGALFFAPRDLRGLVAKAAWFSSSGFGSKALVFYGEPTPARSPHEQYEE